MKKNKIEILKQKGTELSPFNLFIWIEKEKYPHSSEIKAYITLIKIGKN